MSVFLGIDIGTTAIKLGVISEEKFIYTAELPLQTLGTERIKYQEGNKLLSILEKGILMMPADLRQTITTISFSTAMHSLLPDDAHQQVFLWSDTQAAEVMDSFKESSLAAHFYQLTGTPIHAMSTFAKILYFKKNKRYPENIHWYGLKELVMRYFTGQAVIDYATASATGLFDLRQKQWSAEILSFLEISTEQLAELADTNQHFAILPEIRQKLGFSEETQVVIGASDGVLAAYASFYHTGRTASLTIGTSAAVRQLTKEIQLDKEKQNFCYYLNQDYLVSGAPSNNGGCIIAWAAEQLAENSADFFNDLPILLENPEITTQGLRFWPFLNGERAPYWSNTITGGFKGLTLKHTREQMIKSVVEGTLLNISRLVALVASKEELSVSGGFFKTAALGQLAADIFGVNCYYSSQNEPIFGLYYLIEQPEIEHQTTSQIFLSNTTKQQEYREKAKDYFI